MKRYKLAPQREKTEEEITEMLKRGYVPAEFESLNHYEIKRGDILVFRVNKKLPFQSMQRLMHNFTQGLNKLGLKGFFLTENVDIELVLREPKEGIPEERPEGSDISEPVPVTKTQEPATDD